MRIITLVENTVSSDALESQHGLSFYIETQKHHLLFDMGQDDTFIRNARKLGIDLSKVDVAVISHGHYDHGGGLSAFLEINHTAKVFVSQSAFEEHYSYKMEKYVPIGLDGSFQNHPQIELVGDKLRIDEELYLFSNITGRKLFPSSNQNLKIMENGTYQPDPFMHEQALIITENRKNVLFAGCSHNGVINILDKAKSLGFSSINAVFGGFHLHSPGGNYVEPHPVIREIAHTLLEEGGTYYTGHCTGKEAFSIMKEEMGDRLDSISTGKMVEL